MVERLVAVFRIGRSRKRAATFVLVALTLGIGGVFARFAFGDATVKFAKTETIDKNGDGYLDTIRVTFAQPMDTAGSAPNGFTVDDYTLASPPSKWVTSAPGQQTSTQLELNLLPKAVPDTAMVPGVHFKKGATSKAKSFPLGLEPEDTNLIPADAAGPVLMQVFGNDFAASNLFDVNSPDELDMIFSENVKVLGQTPADQMKALELAVKFSAIGTCLGDGNGANSWNFPVPPAQGGKNPIIEPTAAQSSNTIRVQIQTDSTTPAGFLRTPAIPGTCGVGVDPNGLANITDGATPANPAVSQDLGGTNHFRREIQIAPSSLFYEDGNARLIPSIGTQDIEPQAGNGFIDAVKVTFDHNLIDSTVDNTLAGKFTVTNGNEAALVTGVSTGVPGDASLLIHIGGVSWGGGVKPAVSFDSSGCLLHATVPTQTYFSCAGSFINKPSLDKIPPAITGAITADNDLNGLVDHVTVSFTEALNPAPPTTAAGWSVAGTPASAIAIVANSSTATLTIPETAALGSGATPDVAFDAAAGNTMDTIGNRVVSQTIKAADAAGPVLANATSFDTNGDGNVETITYEFSEAVDEATTTFADFTVGSFAATAFGTSPIDPTANAQDKFVTVKISPAVGGTGHVAAHYGGTGLKDLAGIAAPTADKTAEQVADKAAPVAIGFATTPVSPFGAGTVRIDATYSEPLDLSTAPAAAIGSKSATPLTDATHDANGFEVSDPTKWAATVALGSGDCGQQNGCAQSITLTGGKDAAANNAIDATPIAAFVDTLSPDAPTNDTSTPIQDSGTLGVNKVSSHTKNLSVGAAIVAGQVTSGNSGGTAELLLDGNPLTPAVKSSVGGSEETVTLTTSFADAAALRTVISEGVHTVSAKLCDGALNCSTSNGTQITADYTPVPISLAGPHNGSFEGGDHACITWDGDQSASDLADVSLLYAFNGGAPAQIAHGLTADPSGTCQDGTTAGYDWTVPSLNTTTLKIIVRTVDSFGNDKSEASTGNIAVATVTNTITGIAASPARLIYGQATTISGTVTGSGYAVPGKTVTLQRRLIGASSFTTVATTTTSSSGGYKFTTKPAHTADYKVVFAKSGPYNASASTLSRITVLANVPIYPTASTLRRGYTVTFNGSVLPSKAGKKVSLQVLSGGKWVYISTQTLSSRSAYRFTYRLTGTGRRLFRVIYSPQDSLNAGNVSVNKSVRWT